VNATAKATISAQGQSRRSRSANGRRFSFAQARRAHA
jgi:hypothetical protein